MTSAGRSSSANSGRKTKCAVEMMNTDVYTARASPSDAHPGILEIMKVSIATV